MKSNKFGYLIIVSKDKKEKHDYYAMAYLLALSIKRTQKRGYDSVAVVVDDKKYLDIFKALPVFDSVDFWDEKDFWDGRSYMNDLSPWRYTVCLDTDMILTRDCSHWIDYFLDNTSLYVANKVLTYRNVLSTSTHYRETFIKNKLPMLYSAYTFFDNEQTITKSFFTLVQSITENPNEFKNYFLTEHTPMVIGTDEAFALAAKILDIEDDIAYDLDFPRFVHLKPMNQDVDSIITKTGLDLGYYTDKNNKIKVSMFSQIDILHYADKDIDVAQMIENYNNLMFDNFKL
jgi:hypothetical protein